MDIRTVREIIQMAASLLQTLAKRITRVREERYGARAK